MTRRPSPPPAPTNIAPGFFLDLVRKHNWPPMFESRAWSRSDMTEAKRVAALAAREAADRGGGWGTGTIALPKTPKQLAPGWMGATKPARSR